MSGINLTNRLDIIADSLYVFDTDGRMNIPLEIKTKSSLDYVNEIKNSLSINPIITGTLTTDNLVANNDITSKGSLKVNTITAFDAPQININNNVVMSGDLTVGTSNIINALGTKANQITTYTKLETNQQIANVVNGAPELLDTLFELSKAINDDKDFATSMANELATKATNTRVNEIRDALQTSINSTNTNLANNYYNRDVMDLLSTGFQNQINIDTNNLRTNYYTKTEITDIKTILNDEDTSLQNQITADVDNLSTNYFTKTEVTAIQTILNNTDISLQNTDVSLQNQITADVNNLSTNYYNKSNIDDKLILKENILDNNDKLFLKSNKADVYLKEETLSTEQLYDTLQTGIATRQIILAAGSPLNGEALLNGRTIKGVAVNAPLGITSNSSSITISSNTYSKEEINTALGLKSDSTNINASLLLKENITDNDAKQLLKADKTYVDDKLALKADITYTDSLNNLKADKTYVDTQLNLKSDKTYVDTQLNLKSDKTYVDTQLNLKSDKTYVDTQLNLKATKTDVDAALVLKADKSNVDTLLNLKSDKLYVDDALILKSDKTYVDAQLNLKSDKTYVDTQLNLKSDTTYVDTQLNLKSDKTYVDTQLNLKSDKTYVDTQLNLKSDKTYVDTQLNLKSDKTYVDDALILKSDKTYVDAQLNLKSDKTYVDTQLNLKSDKTYVDTQLNLKSDKTIVEDSLLLKSDKTYVDTQLNLKSDKTYVDTQLNLKSDKTTVEASLLLKSDKTYVDTQLNLKSDKTYVDTQLNLKSDKTYVDEQLATKETILNNNTKLGLKADISYVDTLGTNLTYSINAGALNLSTNYYNKTSIDAIKTGIDVSLSNKADKSDTYTKAQVNTIQTNLATSLNNTNDYLNSTIDDLDDNYYTKTEINSGYYNKTEIDTTFTNLIDSAPTNLDTLKEIATALNNDPNMYTTIQTQLIGKQNKFLLAELPLNSARLFDLNSTKFRGIHCSNPLSIVETNDAYLTLDADCYTKAQTDNLINVKSDNSYTDAQLLLKENIIDNDIKHALKENITTNNTKLSSKQNKFLLGELPATNSGRLFDLNSTKFRGIHCGNPLSIVETNDAYLTLDADCYTKAQTDNLISTISLTPGTDGINGTNGTNGIDGINGTNGLKGDKGTDGTNGTNGTNGIDGINGTNGLKGDKGTDGTNGTNGTNGIDGINGTNGLKGDKGTDGTNGTNGTNGIDGINGTNGLKGDKGDKGDIGPAGIYTSGTSSLDSQAIISGSVIKNLKPGTAITLTSDDNSIIISGRDAYTKTETDANYYYKSFIDNTASAWSSGLVSSARHFLSTGTNDLTIRSNTGIPFDIMRIYNSGFVNFTSNVMFDAEPQDITFLNSGAYYTLQSRFDLKQNLITALLPASSTQLLDGTTLKALKAGTNITLTTDETSVTINGPVVSGFQNTLTAAAPVGSHPILNATTIKCLKQGTNITMVSDGTSVTINGPVVSGFQNTLTAATATDAQAILNATTIKCLKPGTGITMTGDTTSVTINGTDSYTKTEVTNSLALKANAASPVFTGNASVGGVLSVTGITNLTGNLSVSRSAPTGNGNVAISATNSGADGFASLYLQTNNQTLPITSTTGQIFVGQNAGMVLHTRTNHPISFQTYSDQPSTTVTPSMKIISSGLRDVEIYTPLRVNNIMTTTGDVDFGRDVEVSRHLLVAGNITCLGNGPWFCAGRINSNGTGSIMSSYGRVGYTLTKNALGQITVNMIDDHLQGANYAVFASSTRPFTIVENGTGVAARTSSSFQISLRNTDFSLSSDTNGITFMVV
jgi:hypothetical protein